MTAIPKFRLAHNWLRNAQQKLALEGKGNVEPIGKFTISWDGIADLAPPFVVGCCGEHAEFTSLESAIDFAAAAMERMAKRISQ